MNFQTYVNDIIETNLGFREFDFKSFWNGLTEMRFYSFEKIFQ